jgi:nucleoside-diphosphate-sugar epimerase
VVSVVRIAITGAGGFIGVPLGSRLEATGHVVVRLGRADADLGAASGPALEQLLAGCEVLLHLAARAHVMRETAADPLAEFRRVNVAGSARLAAAAVSAGVRRLVFVSSVGVHGNATVGRPFTAADPAAPHDAYAISKGEAEQALARVSSLELVVVRPPLVYGPRVRGNFLRLLTLIARRLPLPFGAVDNRRSFIGVDNLCDFLATCALHPAAAGERFVVSDDHDVSTPELLAVVGRGLGHRVRLPRIPVGLLRAAAAVAGRSADLERLVGSLSVDSTHARRVLGWRAPLPFEAGILAMTDWYKREFGS